MFSVCRLFGKYRMRFWGVALFLWLCLFCFEPLFAQAVEQNKHKNATGQTLRYVADKFFAFQQAPRQFLLAQPLAHQPVEDQLTANRADSELAIEQATNLATEQAGALDSSSSPELSSLRNETAKTDQAERAGVIVQPEQLGLAKQTQAVQQRELPEPEWEVLEDGLESTLVSILPMQNATQAVNVNVLRIEPEKWDFELLTASEFGRSKSLWQWAQDHKLVAAINASMYLPDGKTSTGYMRRGEHINNGRIVTNFGAFFVAMPENTGLPQAAVLDRNDDSWQSELEQYKIVVQNYRLMTPQGKPLWGPDLLNSLAAIGQDEIGRILFLHCGQPVSAIAFVEGLMRMPLGLVRLMYVEGGHQAAMLVDTKVKNQVWTGKYAALLDSNSMPPLPNVIGVKHKPEKIMPENFNTNATVE